jgi:hypothetical protein
MTRHVETDELHVKRLCFQCIGEKYLSAEVQREGARCNCSYCNCQAESYTIDDLAERIEEVFQQHYTLTSDQPDSWQRMQLSDRESNYEWERAGVPIIQAIVDAAVISEKAAQDIQSVLDNKHNDFEIAQMGEETEFSSNSFYEEKGTSDHAWQMAWSDFERTLKTEARFFNRSAATHLASIFDGIENISATTGAPMVIDAGPGAELNAIYRARIFQSDDALKNALCRPDQHLGSPPSQLATAGRMSARGISVFYGATEPVTAIAEVRPPVGSQVAVARFKIIRPLRLLDLTALANANEGGSLFDSELDGRLQRAMFLQSLSTRITRAVMPDDEDFEYLATQAVADFLATEQKPPIDGIVFPSTQAAGKTLNVVLFHKAARTAALDIPGGTEINARTGVTTEDGWEVEYSITEELPANQTSVIEEGGDMMQTIIRLAGTTPCSQEYDAREETLKIELDSINVHVIQCANFNTVEYSVSRHRWTKQELKS